MFLWILFLHNYIIPQKRLHPFFFWMQPFLLFFYSPFKFIQKSADLKEICTCVDSELN